MHHNMGQEEVRVFHGQTAASHLFLRLTCFHGTMHQLRGVDPDQCADGF